MEWRSDPKLNKWYRRLTDGILGDVQSTYGCVLYHASNIDRMESSIGYLIEVFDKSLLGNATIGVGNTQRLDFEYHAFIFCYRRTLDYLARSLSSYFRIDCTSFRTMDKSIKTTGYPSVSEALIEEHKKRLPLFDFVVSKGAKKTVRDLLAHYHGISAGSLNIDAHGWQLFQGGEDLEMGHSPVVSLSSSLSRRIDHLRETIAAFLSIFASEARKLEP